MNRIIHNLWIVQFAYLRITLLLLLFELYLYIYAHVQASDCWCISYLGAHINGNGNKTKNNPPKNFELKIASLGNERERESELDKKCSGFAPNMQNVKLNWTCCYSLSPSQSRHTNLCLSLFHSLCHCTTFRRYFSGFQFLFYTSTEFSGFSLSQSRKCYSIYNFLLPKPSKCNWLDISFMNF